MKKQYKIRYINDPSSTSNTYYNKPCKPVCNSPIICNNTDGCVITINSKCVNYNGIDYPVLNIFKGQDLNIVLTSIINNLGGGTGGTTYISPTNSINVSGDGSSSNHYKLNSNISTATNNSIIINTDGLYSPNQINSDWNSIAGFSRILNKPDLSIYYLASNPDGYVSNITYSMVITALGYTPVNPDGAANEYITGNGTKVAFPNIPAAQVPSDWDAISGVSRILNKPIIDKAYIGLGNVDNTSDLDKPISTSTQNALDDKEDISNKSTSITLGTSNFLYPTQNAVKTYVDNSLVNTIGNYIPLSQKAANNGVATLGATGKIPLTQIAITTSNVTEGTNLYYTNTRVKTYSDTLYVPLSRVISTGVGLLGGDDLSNDLTLDLDFNYLDDRYSSGYKQKTPARVATISNITLSGLQTIDGVVLVAGERVLVKNQTSPQENGIYIVASGAWTRSTDFDIVGPGEVEQGAAIFIQEGTTNNKTGWSLSTAGTIVLNTTPLTFIQYAGANSYSASTGLTLVGNTFSALVNSNLWNANKLQNIGIVTTAPTTNQILRYNGTSWAPFTPNYLVTETDPVANSKTVNLIGTAPIIIAESAQTISSNPEFTLSHGLSGVVAGSYPKVNVNTQGHVISGSNLVSADIPALDTSKITTGVFNTIRLGAGTPSSSTYLRGDGSWINFPNIPQGTVTSISITSGDITVTGSPITTSGTITLTLPNIVAAGTYKSVAVNAKGLITSGTNPTTLAGYGINDAYTKVQSDSLYKPISYSPTLTNVLTAGNQANKDIILGGSGQTNPFSYRSIRTISSVDYTATFGSGAAGGAFIQTTSGATNRLIYLRPAVAYPEYSPDGGTTLQQIWTSTTHPAGSVFTGSWAGNSIIGTLTTNTSGHITSMTTRTLTIGDIGAAAASHTHTLTLTGAVTGTGTVTGSIATTLANFDGSKITTGTVAGARLGAGSGSYIQNSTTLQSAANFNISGNGLIGGNLGVGTTVPDGKLHVVGVGYIGGGATPLSNRLKINSGTGGVVLAGQTWNGTTWVQNDIYLESYTLNLSDNLRVEGVVQIQGGTPGAGKVLTSDASGNATWQVANAGSSKTLKDFYTDIGNTSTNPSIYTVLYQYSIPGNTLAVVGQKIMANYSGRYGNNNNFKGLDLFVDGFGVGAAYFSTPPNSRWSADVFIIRTGASTARATFTVIGSSINEVGQIDLTGLNFANPITIELWGSGSTINDVIAKQGTIQWVAAA